MPSLWPCSMHTVCDNATARLPQCNRLWMDQGQLPRRHDSHTGWTHPTASSGGEWGCIGVRGQRPTAQRRAPEHPTGRTTDTRITIWNLLEHIPRVCSAIRRWPASVCSLASLHVIISFPHVIISCLRAHCVQRKVALPRIRHQIF